MSLLGRKITSFLKKVTDLPDRPSPTYSASEIKAQFDSSPEELRVALNGLIDDLTSSSPGASGTDQVGAAPIPGLTGTTIYSQLAGIKALLDGATNQNAFAMVAVPGQNVVAADTASDTLTLTGGTGIAITTNQGTDTVTITATGSSTPGAHAASHITGGADVIPDAVALGNSGLMSGIDKGRLNTVYNGAPIIGARVSRLGVTTTVATTVLTYTNGRTEQRNFMIPVHYVVSGGTTTVTITVTDVARGEVTTLVNAAVTPNGSYATIPLFIPILEDGRIDVKVTASAANRVFISTSIVEV